jgi:hypothetical protein
VPLQRLFSAFVCGRAALRGAARVQAQALVCRLQRA